MNLFKRHPITTVRALKLCVHLLSASWLGHTYWLALHDRLGADPVEAILHFTGIGAFHLLLLCLSISPLARALKFNALMRMRRIVGLWSFIYAFCHVASFALFELQLEWRLIGSEIIERPYITVGFAAFLILFALALTSVNALQRRWGRRWQMLHHLIYPAALLIALHYLWSVKSEWITPTLYGVAVAILLALRWGRIRKFYGLN